MGYIRTSLFLLALLLGATTASAQCGNTIAWNNPSCQIIGSGSVLPQWTVISRHGEYAQGETECNIPGQITQGSSGLTITTKAQSYTCGDFGSDGSVCSASDGMCAPDGQVSPSSFPYITGDMQMASFNFSPNGTSGSTSCAGTCTITIVGQLPDSNTNLWPAWWLLGANCQDANKWSGDTGFDRCPNQGGSGYIEIDMVECYNSGGGCQFHVANPSFGIGGGCDASYTWDTNQHTWKTVWTSSSISEYEDGTLVATCHQAITAPMFLIFQIQTGGVGGTPANLPASMVTKSITITDANDNTIFSDNFSNHTAGDFDGDGKADFAVWRPSNGTWFVIPSKTPNSVLIQQWGVSTDIPVRGDFDGDGKTDFAVWRPSNGIWFIIPSSNPSSPIIRQWGANEDIPVPGDYDGDGKTDFAVWRPSNGTWFIIPSSNPSSPIIRQWGANGDIPVPGDYDGDGKTDFAVWRPSNGNWFIIPSSNPSSPIIRQWGASGDMPVPGDYDGDGKTDFAVWRPSSGDWYIIPSSNPASPILRQWGTMDDIPVPADYDGDLKTDMAVWRPSNGDWYVLPSSAPGTFTITQWGANGDIAIQKPTGQ